MSQFVSSETISNGNVSITVEDVCHDGEVVSINLTITEEYKNKPNKRCSMILSKEQSQNLSKLLEWY